MSRAHILCLYPRASLFFQRALLAVKELGSEEARGQEALVVLELLEEEVEVLLQEEEEVDSKVPNDVPAAYLVEHRSQAGQNLQLTLDW